MSSSVQSNAARLGFSIASREKLSGASLRRADEEICPYVPLPTLEGANLHLRRLRNFNDQVAIWPHYGSGGEFQPTHLYSHRLEPGHFSLTAHQHALPAREMVLNLAVYVILHFVPNLVLDFVQASEIGLQGTN